MRPIFRIALVVCAAAASLPAVTSAGTPDGGFNATCTPQGGVAPVTVAVIARGGTARHVADICAYVDWGDGTAAAPQCAYCLSWEGCDGDRIRADVYAEFSHTLVCPGTYTVHAHTDPYNCTGCDFMWDVVVTAPELNLVAVCEPQGTSCRLYASSAVDVAHVVRATVDWGDGSPPQEFVWYADGAWFRAPGHDYAEAGYYTVRVVNEIEGTDCAWAQASALTVNPGYTTPTENATWGRVKALYRGNE